MERKRRLPARAARVEHVAKKRTITPPEKESASATPAPEPQTEEPPAELPKSVQPGKPLPTVEEPQPESLPGKDFQSIQERSAPVPNKAAPAGVSGEPGVLTAGSGVLVESLQRSRQKWIADGLFEKYWKKPSKSRKGGVPVMENPNNPPKDSMTKLGQVTITIEPHVFDATMFAVKAPKPPPTTSSAFRPILQYGPPNGSMPPPGTPVSGQSSPAPPVSATSKSDDQPKVSEQQPPNSGSGAAAEPARPSSKAAPDGIAPTPTLAPPPAARQETQPTSGSGAIAPPASASPSTTTALSRPQTSDSVPPPPLPATRTAPQPQKSTDPIIIALAEKAAEDAQLRDLMKKVAEGKASADELAHFQRVIDQITTEYKKKGGQQGPSPDRLMVDGKTVKYFADEVRQILHIVLSSNSSQRSADLRPPAGSNPLVVLLVKAALDDQKTKAMIHRIADGKPSNTDATDLKAVLDSLHKKIMMEKMQKESKASEANSARAQGSQTTSNGILNEGSNLTASPVTASPRVSQQALRSKGPVSLKSDITAIVFEFAGGSGDRYLFPKFSILDYEQGGQQVVCSFLLVRKGSMSEYGADPALDYYQPITIRLYSPSGRHLENLARVVAPEDEVRRYMDHVMETMTRAEYVLLAMRLPRPDRDDDKDDQGVEEPATNGSSAKSGEQKAARRPLPGAAVLWGQTTPRDASPAVSVVNKEARDDGPGNVGMESDEYVKFVQSKKRKEPEP